MKSKWLDEEEERGSGRLGPCVYGARLLGSDRQIVLSGGGNASVKEVASDTLYIKASGYDMADLNAQGMPAVSLSKTRALRKLQALSDADMVATLRTFMDKPDAPSPSVETLMHAFLPHGVVYHTHPVAVLCLTDQPEAEKFCLEAFDDMAGFVPYAPSGFELAKAVINAFETNPSLSFLILEKHGLVSIAKTAKEAYEASITAISCAENYIKKNKVKRTPASRARKEKAISPMVNRLEEALGTKVSVRQSDKILRYVNMPDLEAVSQRGVATPGDVLRTKPWPMIWREKEPLKKALVQFREKYRAYVKRHGGHGVGLNTDPAVILVPNVGLLAAGRDQRDAEKTADVGEFTAKVILCAEAMGRYTPINESDMFQVEFMSLEGGKAQKVGH